MAGDRDGDFTGFARAAMPRLLRLGYLLTLDRYLAEDLVQEALGRTYARWNRLRDPSSAEGYCRTTMTRLAISAGRRPRLKTVALDGTVEPAVPTRHEPDLSTDELVELLRSLPDRKRAVVVLRMYADLPVAEVAGLLGVSEGTVKSQNHEALELLREQVGIRHGKGRTR
jgi:RNA polymerase sigma-70 factor (sigma-E family)